MANQDDKSKKYAWFRCIEAQEDLAHSIDQDKDYIQTLITSMKQSKKNKMALSLIDMFLWEFVSIKYHVFNECFYDYTTTVIDGVHYDPDGKELYKTKKGIPHIITKQGKRITKEDFVIDFEKNYFKLNNNWEYIVTKKADYENEKPGKGYWKKK